MNGSGPGGLDWSVHDADVTLSGFIAPEHYASEVWKIHTVDPFQFYEEPLRSELLSKAVRKVEPRAGKIDYDIEGTILGNWFLEGTIDYGGNTDDSEYWKGHLAIAYGWIDPSQVRISIGFDTGINHQLCKVCFGAYGVRGNQPDPATAKVADKVINKLKIIPIPHSHLINDDMLEQMKAALGYPEIAYIEYAPNHQKKCKCYSCSMVRKKNWIQLKQWADINVTRSEGNE